MSSSGMVGGSTLRHLPIYLLLDCSGSMVGDPIEAVNEGLGMIYRQLMSDPQAVETVMLSVIRFAEAAEQDDLTSLISFVPPTLSASGPTAMGSAFHILEESIRNDLSSDSGTAKGDYRPLVFLLTDGKPTDEWRSEVNKLKALTGNRRPIIVALGCGGDVDPAMLREVTSEVFLLKDATPEQIKAYFRWISGSIIKVSHAVSPTTSGGEMESPVGVVPGVIKWD